MILVDTSAWVELLRATGSPAHHTLRSLIERSADIAITEIVVMELLAGAGSTARARELRSRLLAYEVLPLVGLGDFEEAASLHRTCRLAGETLRSLSDCLIAVPALRVGAEVLHHDADFDVLARHTGLLVHVPA